MIAIENAKSTTDVHIKTVLIPLNERSFTEKTPISANIPKTTKIKPKKRLNADTNEPN
jgi:hypothetical protein